MKKLAFIVAFLSAAPAAMGWQSILNGFGMGSAQIKIWCYPVRPPVTPSHSTFSTNSPNVQLGPNLEGCRPGTFSRTTGGERWRQRTDFRASGGDTVDWHSMLPFVTPVSPSAFGSLEVTSNITGNNSATYTVNWFGSDEGVAMHIGWFEGATLLHQEMRIGPWSEQTIVSINSSGPILAVSMETSGAAVSLPPECCSNDFNGDGDIGTDADIEAFFGCLAGACCPTCGSADYNCDGDIGTDADIEAFFSVLGGGAC
jgi:hypothetical protein